MNTYDYDAPTQLSKVEERNERYVDATVTVPHRVLYPLCSMNVAFHRNLIGVAFMQGLMGIGQPWARYDDMFAGWASKVVADALGVGCKSGAPYVLHNKASNPFVNLKKEYMGFEWQEHAIRFFDNVQLTKHSADELYIELADKVKASLGYLSPYFHRQAEAMKIWVDLWRRQQAGQLVAVPSRSSKEIATKEAKAGRGSHVLGGTAGKLWDRIYPNASPTNLSKIPSCARKLKVFVYDLSAKWNSALLDQMESSYRRRSNCDYARSHCQERARDDDPHGLFGIAYSNYRQYAAEVPLLAKFLQMPQTDDPEQADLFVVPYFHSTDQAVLGEPFHVCTTSEAMDIRLHQLFKLLPHFVGAKSSKHMFLASRDKSNIALKLLDMVQSSGAIVLHYGPSAAKNEIVVAPSDSGFSWPVLPLKMPADLLFFMAGDINPARHSMFEQLEKLKSMTPAGLTARVMKISDHRLMPVTTAQSFGMMEGSLLCPIAMGDLPYQHRFYDSLVAGCLPLVLTSRRMESGVPCDLWSWAPDQRYVHWASYKPGTQFCRNATNPCSASYEKSYAFSRSIPYSQIAVQLDANYTELFSDILNLDYMELLKRRTLLDKYRKYLVYDWSGQSFDAFSATLYDICHAM
jgi:hypothetical protein